MLEIKPAQRDDLSEIEHLIELASLPRDGLEAQFPQAYVVAWRNERVVGVAGLELHDRLALLRSVAVDPAACAQGVGRALVADRLNAARRAGVQAVYLLTTTAEAYFERFGFQPASRAEVSAELATTPEFTGACPASAACLALNLQR